MNNHLIYTGFALSLAVVIVAAVKDWLSGRNKYQSSLTTPPMEPNVPHVTVSDGVNDPQAAAELFRQIQRDMAETFGFLPSNPVCAQLAPASEINRRMGFATGRWLFDGICGVEDGRLIIFMRNGLSVERFYVTLAHEYAHAWQRLDGFESRDFERNEGFAEWVALVLTRKAGFDVEQLFCRPADDPYRTGMQRFAALEALYGPRKAAQLAKRSGFDLGYLRADYNCFQSGHPAARRFPHTTIRQSRLIRSGHESEWSSNI